MTADRSTATRDPLTERIIGFATEVHRSLGPGLLESAYEECVCYELAQHRIQFKRQVPCQVVYKGVQLDCGCRLDLVVADQVIVELKAIERLLPVHDAQLLTYLRLTGLKTGLLLNFHTPVMRDGIRRFVL